MATSKSNTLMKERCQWVVIKINKDSDFPIKIWYDFHCIVIKLEEIFIHTMVGTKIIDDCKRVLRLAQIKLRLFMILIWYYFILGSTWKGLGKQMDFFSSLNFSLKINIASNFMKKRIGETILELSNIYRRDGYAHQYN